MKTKISALILACGLLVSCGAPVTTTTQNPPNSPQTQAANINKAVADADVAAVQTVISLRDAGKVSQATTTTIENWLAFVATNNKQIAAVFQKPETWDQQKVEIYTLLGTVTAPSLATTIDPGAQAVVTQILTLINQIKVQVQP